MSSKDSKTKSNHAPPGKMTGKNKPHKQDVSHVSQQLLAPYIKQAQIIRDRKSAVLKDLKDAKALVGDYFKVGSKEGPSLIDRELKTLELELSALRSAVRSAIGVRTVRVKLFQTYDQTCNASGVVATATTIDPTTVTEFASLADLFDEFKVTAFDYHYQPMQGVQVTSGAAKTALCVVGYDPTDLTVLAGVPNGMQLAQSKLIAVPTQNNTLIQSVNVGLHHFNAKVLSGELLNQTNVSTSTWQNTVPPPSAASVLPYGWLKTYATTFAIVSGPAVSGLLTYHCDFRSRA